MNQGKLEVVKQEMARVNIDILGISELSDLPEIRMGSLLPSVGDLWSRYPRESERLFKGDAPSGGDHPRAFDDAAVPLLRRDLRRT